MPKIYEYLGYIIFFYSNEHLPIHIHVKKQGMESVLELIIENGNVKDIIVRDNTNNPLSDKDIAIIKKFTKVHSKNIIQKWVKYFVMNKSVRCTKITRRI